MSIRKTDQNQAEIVRALRQIGASVTDTSQLGNGFPDIVVGYRRRNFLFEIKNSRLPPSARKLTPAEQEFHETWRGIVHIIQTEEQAISIVTKDSK